MLLFAGCVPALRQRNICHNDYSVLGIKTKSNKQDSVIVDVVCFKNPKGWIDTIYIPCSMKHDTKNRKQ